MSAPLRAGTAHTTVHRRVAVLWFPDWPVYAIGQAQGWNVLEPAAVISEYRILACNAAARRAGVKAGMKQRHALATCPGLNVAAEDPAQQAAVHEDVLTALDAVAAGVETIRPGLLAFPMHSLARFYGSEDIAGQKLLDAAARMQADCLLGTADDLITAVWAARVGRNIGPGEAQPFISALPITALTIEPSLHGPTGLVTTLNQLGVRTLRDFAALPVAEAAARFGQEAVVWHRVACGDADRDVSPRRVAEPLEVSYEAPDPISRTETAAFVARHVAARLHALLFDANKSCTRLAVRAHLQPSEGYEGPTTIERVWRCREPLTEEETAQRIRWQLDGWITRLRGDDTQSRSDQRSAMPDTSEWTDHTVGVSAIELCPVEVITAGSVKVSLWGGPDDGIRAARAAAGRAQALIGTHAVRRAVHRGGRAVAGRIRTVPYGEDDPEELSQLPTTRWEGELQAPLPGLIGAPAGGADTSAPSARHPAAAIGLRDAYGQPVYVTGRGLMSSPPETMTWGRATYRVTGWAGPWPVDEDWWAAGKRYARLQVAIENNPGDATGTGQSSSAFLLVCKGTRWRIEATY